jgi:class 3 adenylate cyclase
MPLYMDRHDPLPTPVSAQELADAHVKDVEIQEKYGVRYISYWFDPANQHVFCLVDAPAKEAAEAVHRDSHGLTANAIIEVDPSRIATFLGTIEEPPLGEARSASALRTILFTDIENSTSLTQRLGDETAMHIVRAHDKAVRDALGRTEGREVKHTGDGIMACFGSVVQALDCALHVQSTFAEHLSKHTNETIRLRIGISAGEPVTEHHDLYGAAVQLAARVCAACEPGGILASSVVRDLAIGKRYDWEFRGEAELKGFDEPVRLYSLRWDSVPVEA